MNIRLSAYPTQHHFSNLECWYIPASKYFLERAAPLLHVQTILTLLFNRTLRFLNTKMLKMESVKVRRDIDSNVREDKKCLPNV